MASVHSQFRKPALSSCGECSSRPIGQSAKIQRTNLAQVSKSPSCRDVFSTEQTIFFFPPKRGVGNHAASIAHRQFSHLTVFFVGHFLRREIVARSSLTVRSRRAICGMPSRSIPWQNETSHPAITVRRPSRETLHVRAEVHCVPARSARCQSSTNFCGACG